MGASQIPAEALCLGDPFRLERNVNTIERNIILWTWTEAVMAYYRQYSFTLLDRVTNR